jgi:hypothetical protein
MTFALTKVTAYGIEASEPLQKRFKQVLILEGTAANTNVAYDFGTYAGTFWTAVGGTEPGTSALKAVKDIQIKAKAFISASGVGLSAYSQTSATNSKVLALTSAAYGGGSATPTLTVTGLLTTDTILGATQILKNQNSLPLIGAAGTCATNDQYAVVYSADPGTTGTVRVVFSRAAANTVAAGTYQLSMDATNTLIPDILFLSGDAPTAFKIVLQWILKDQEIPEELYVSA